MSLAQLKLFSPNDRSNRSIVDDILEFSDFKRKTEVFVSDGIRYFVNEFWTSKQRQSNRLHEISYRACFKAELPRFFIDRLSYAGDFVYDPFMGRGTTLIEAALSSRFPVGNDINPLSAMLVGPRLAPPSLKAIITRLNQIPSTWSAP